MTIINSIYKGKRYAILLTTILTFYAPVLFAQHIADSALVEVAYGQQPEWRHKYLFHLSMSIFFHKQQKLFLKGLGK